MKIVITILAIALIIMSYVQITIIKRLKLVEEHTEIVGQTMKEFSYAIDVLTELQKGIK